MEKKTYQTFGSVDHIAHRLGVPQNWLKGMMAMDRIPYLIVGKRKMMNFEQVRDVLLHRAVSGNGSNTRVKFGPIPPENV